MCKQVYGGLKEQYHKNFNMIEIRQICIFCVFMQFHVCDASHDAGGSRGIANISLEDTSLLTISGYKIVCTLASDTDIPVTFTWHWNSSAPAKDPQLFFEWNYDKDIGIDGRQNYKSSLTWKSGVSLADKKSVRGAIVYGKGSHGDDASSCPDVTLNIMWKPGMASVLRSPASGNILRDSTLIMTCSGDKGSPDGSVTWKINGTTMTGDMYNTDEITINAAQSEHDGDWLCYFTNGLGSGVESEIQTVEIKWKPGPCSLKLNPDDDSIILGRKLLLTCTCLDKGKPIGEINWSLNGIKKTGTMYQSDEVTIDEVETPDAGDWECYYRNAIGNGQPSSKTIDVRYRPDQPELTVDTDVELIRLGDKVTLECLSKDRGHPEGHPVWLKDDVMLQGDQYSSQTVTFTATDGSVNGVWNCYYSNQVGNSNLSNHVEIDVKCLPMIHMEFITYEFSSDSVDFNLKIRNPVAAITLEILICTNIDSDISCHKATTKIEESVNQNVELPKTSTSEVYNVTFTFADEHGIVTQHGIALKDSRENEERNRISSGAVKQNQIPTILAVLFGILFAAALVTIASLIYVFYWRHRIKGVTTQADTAVQYVNVGSVAHSGGITNTTTSQEYEDVATANAANSQTAENTNYMDLNQTDVQQTRNRPAELTVYQSLNGTQ